MEEAIESQKISPKVQARVRVEQELTDKVVLTKDKSSIFSFQSSANQESSFSPISISSFPLRSQTETHC